MGRIIFIPLCGLCFLVGAAFIIEHPIVLPLTLLTAAMIFFVLKIYVKRNPHPVKKRTQSKLPPRRKTTLTEADFWRWFNGQNKK